MSLKPSPIGPVPEETARVAKAAFRRGNPPLKLRDELGAVFADADFADLFPTEHEALKAARGQLATKEGRRRYARR